MSRRSEAGAPLWGWGGERERTARTLCKLGRCQPAPELTDLEDNRLQSWRFKRAERTLHPKRSGFWRYLDRQPQQERLPSGVAELSLLPSHLSHRQCSTQVANAEKKLASQKIRANPCLGGIPPNIQVSLGKGGWRLGGLTFSPSALPLSARSC